MSRVSNDEQRMREELEELFRPVVAERMEQFLETLRQDRAFLREVFDRFERGRLRGHYPALSEILDDEPEDYKEEFLSLVGLRAAASLLPPKDQPWDASPFCGRVDSYREELYGGMAYLYRDELRDFAQEWLEELRRVGYRGMTTVVYEDGATRFPSKQQTGRESSVKRPLGAYGQAYPVLFDNSSQVLWLQLDGDRSLDRGYREVMVSDEPIKTDRAIIAALTALEARPVDTDRLHSALRNLTFPLEDPMYVKWPEALKDLPNVSYDNTRPLEEYLNKVSKQMEESGHGSLPYSQYLDYVLLLLRYHRPRFDDLPRDDQLGLIEQTCAQINTFLEALRKLTSFLEYGVPGKRQTAAVRDADRDVRAAVRRDVDGLTYREIGRILAVPPPADYDFKGDHPRVRQMVNRGRRILERTLGKAGWQEQIREMKVEATRWNSLSEVEHEAESVAEILGIPYDKALREAKQDVARREEHRANSRPEPD